METSMEEYDEPNLTHYVDEHGHLHELEVINTYGYPTTDEEIKGLVLLAIGILGVASNLLCLHVLSRERQLHLSPSYLFLVKTLSLCDLTYLLASTPATVAPFIPFIWDLCCAALPYLSPILQMAMTASIYTTVTLGFERWQSLREMSRQCSSSSAFPLRLSIASVLLFSAGFNAPRLMQLRHVQVVTHVVTSVNDSLINPVSNASFVLVRSTENRILPRQFSTTTAYMLGYQLIGSLLISLLIPVVILGTLNTLIWLRLREIRKRRAQLGVRERRNTRAAMSLVLIVLLYFICHTPKLGVTLYELLEVLAGTDPFNLAWPEFIHLLVYFSHVSLALGASINIILYCACDKHFFAVVANTLGCDHLHNIANHENNADNNNDQENVELLPVDQNDRNCRV